MTRLRHDLNFLSSLGLIGSGLAAGATGLIADLWDLNDFWYHTVSGYVMGGVAAVHVLLNWNPLVNYAKFRLRRQPGRPAAVAPAAPRAVRRTEAIDPPGRPLPVAGLARGALSRRALLGATVGAAGGWLLGRGLKPAPPIEAGSDLGVVYHEWSKPGIIDALGTVTNWGPAPPLYKTYPEAPAIALPEPDLKGGLSTAEAASTRRSHRAYAIDRPLSVAELSRLLFLGGGVSADRWGNARRTAPSSGALYPIELYPVVHRVDGVGPGVYHYAVREHALELVRSDDLRARIVEQGLGQEFLGECGVVVFLTQILQRMRFKYQDRSYRYGVLEAGHVGQNLYLAATSMGLGACGVGAFMDDDINRMLGVDGTEEAVLYLVAVGRLREAAA